jgi:ABC-type polysaccharide/polyol phosphate export permease
MVLLKQDLKEKYLGSLFGALWAFFTPLFTLLVMWLVFQYGFGVKKIDGYPYIVWLACGLIPWFFFSEALLNATTAIKLKSYLIKKTNFEPVYLPIIKIFSVFIVYLVLLFFLFFLLLINHIKLNFYDLLIIYYSFCLVLLLIALSLITSSLILFLPDVGEFVNIVITFGFWITPVFWSYKVVPMKYRFLLKINPMYYIIHGFRDSIIYHKNYIMSVDTIIFWCELLFFLLLGIFIF